MITAPGPDARRTARPFGARLAVIRRGRSASAGRRRAAVLSEVRRGGHGQAEPAGVSRGMAPPITIRAELPEDAPTIANVVQRAYAGVPYSDQREHRMIERLRETDAYIPALSLLA